MKKLLLAGTALVGVAILSSPAHADLKLDLGGYFRGYAAWTDNDEVGTAADGDDLRNLDFRRDTEVQFTGETTTDQGLTVGVHSELKLGNISDPYSNYSAQPSPISRNSDINPNMTDEAYIYFSGGWGRVNFGSEDGSAYLLQVAAPSADSNVDGLRVYVQGFNPNAWDDGDVSDGAPFPSPSAAGSLSIPGYVLGYDNADFRNTDRLTYLTPKWNGFQAGVSYAPQAQQNAVYSSTGSALPDDNVADYEQLWEAAARWDGEFQGFGVSVGAGYSTAQTEVDNTAGNYGSDDMTTWDAGLNLAWQGWSLGGGYRVSNTGTSGPDTDVTTWVVGGGWDNGPWHAGLSYYDQTFESNAYGLGAAGLLADDIDLHRWTVGGGYTYGPGMTFRGSVAWLDVDNGTGTNDPTQTQVSFGTDVNF